MGNIITNLQQKFIVSEDVQTPEMKSLDDAQIKMIKKTWEIPSVKVNLIEPIFV